MAKDDILVSDLMQLSDDTFELYASADAKAAQTPEFSVKLLRAPNAANAAPKNGLNGKVIVLDPGHFGGAYAKVEDRIIQADMPDGTAADFNEGTLNMATALHLKELLSKAGATVHLTKDAVGKGAISASFEEWKNGPEFLAAVEKKIEKIADSAKRQAARDWWLKESTDLEKFRMLYNSLDIEERVKVISQLKPDLTLFIHYNAGSTKDPVSGKNILTKENYCMAFVGGSYMKGELATPESRQNFVKQLFGDSLDESAKVSSLIVKELVTGLGINPVSEHNEIAQELYLKKSCVKICDGVYARNMSSTQKVPGVVCYAEPLCQDNETMCRVLNDKSHKIGGLNTSPYVTQVAQAYYNGISKYFGVVEAPKSPLKAEPEHSH